MPRHQGALPDHMLRNLIDSRHIRGAVPESIGSSSLNLLLSNECYRVEGIVQPRIGEPVQSLLPVVGARKHNLAHPMEVGVSYLVKLQESVFLPSQVYGYGNPRSNSGRNDVHCRILTDGVPRFDAIIPAGHRGDMWAAITPKSYPVIIPAGMALVQSRFFTSDTRFSEIELEVEMERTPLVYSPQGEILKYQDLQITDQDGSILLTLDLDLPWIGYRCRRPSRVVDFSKTGHPKEVFFERIRGGVDMLRLHRGEFYILSTHEYVRVPPHLSCEMVDMDSRTGEFRSHYAGYIDAGWGFGPTGRGKGRPLTLEVRPFEDLVIRRGQAIAKIRFERMAALPEQHYDANAGSHFRRQYTAQLSKHFA